MSEERKEVALVIGGAGFVGSHLCEILLDSRNVIAVDNYSSGHEGNIHDLLSHSSFEFIRHDITQSLDLEAQNLEKFSAAFAGVKEIYFVAGPGSPKSYLGQSIPAIHTVTEGLKNTLDLAVKYRSRVVYVSDELVYGQLPEGSGAPKEEMVGNLDFLEVGSRYAQARRESESLVQTYIGEYGLDVRTVRLFESYGPGMSLDDGRLVPTLIADALAGQDLVVPPALKSVCLCYITDVVHGLQAVMTADDGGIFNLGHITSYTVEELAGDILKLTGATTVLKREELTGDMASIGQAWARHGVLPNISKIKDATGWFPLTVLDDGLKQTVDYMKSLRGVKGIVT